MLLGTDNVLTILLTDSAGDAINLTTFTDLIVVLKDRRNLSVKYSRDTKAGYNSDDITQLNQTTDTGKFTLTITDAVTKQRSADSGQFELAVKATDSGGRTYGWTIKEVEVTSYNHKENQTETEYKPLNFQDFIARYD